MTRVLAVRPRIRWPYALLPALLLVLVACGDDDTSRGEEIVAPAIDACSRVGNSGDLGPCGDRVRFARERCTTLSAPAATSCAAQLDELTLAAQEAYHLHHGQCDAMSSDAARSACTLTASLMEPTATPTPIAAALATESPTPDSSDENTEPGPALAAALWACGIAEAQLEEDACERALDDGRELCERLEWTSARDDCERALEQLEFDGSSGNSDNRGAGNEEDSSGRGASGNNNRNGNND